MSRYKPQDESDERKWSRTSILLVGLSVGLCSVVLTIILGAGNSRKTEAPTAGNNVTEDTKAEVKADEEEDLLDALEVRSFELPEETPKPPAATPVVEFTAVPSPTADTTRTLFVDRATLKENFDPTLTSHYLKALEFLTEDFEKNGAYPDEWKHTLLSAIATNHGSNVTNRFQHIFEGDLIRTRECAFSLIRTFAPIPSHGTVNRSIYSCAGSDRMEALKLLTVKAIHPLTTERWQRIIETILDEYQSDEKIKGKSLYGQILMTRNLRNSIPIKSRSEIAAKLPTKELIEVLQTVADVERALSRRLAELIDRKKLIPFPRNILLKPFKSDSRVFVQLRLALARSLKGPIDPEVIELLDTLPSELSKDLLLVSCATTKNSELLEKLHTLLLSRSIPEPARGLVKSLAQEKARIRISLMPAVCLSPYYSRLSEEDKKVIIALFGKKVNDDEFVEHIVESNSKELIKDFTVAHGKNFGLHILKFLEKYPDTEVREATKEYLKWYRS